jgi:ATP-dependent Clp protease protease subunit
MKYESQLSHKAKSTILLEKRIINLVGTVDDGVMEDITTSLLIMDSESDDPIQMFIHSPGGSVLAGEAIINQMRFIKSPVITILNGLGASMGAAIFAMGDYRVILPLSKCMLHQVSASEGGNIQDMRVGLKFTEDLNDELLTLIGERCGKTLEQIKNDTIRDKWMFAKECVEYGLADIMVVRSSEIDNIKELKNLKKK